MNNRFAPAGIRGRNHQQGATVAVGSHRGCELHQHVYRIVPGCRKRKCFQRLQQVGTIRKAGTELVDDLRLLALQDRDVRELSKSVNAAVLYYQESRLNVLDDKA